MKLEAFFEKFELFADAPDAVAKMRELVLELAVQGKLVGQKPNDDSVDELLRQIELTRSRTGKTANGRKLERLPPIEPDDSPFEIPHGWAWCPLGNLGLIGSSCRVHEKDWTTIGVPFLRAREIVKLANAGTVNNDLFITEEHYRRLAGEGLIPEPDDIMITGVGTIGVPYIVRDADRFYFKDASVLILKNCFHLYPHYLHLVMQSPYWVREVHKESMGTTVHTLTIVRAKQTPIPLPPLAEQKRIVAKVDELMALCDRLEAQQQEREIRRAALARASLARFADAPTPANLHFIFHNTYDISPADLRKSILTLAVQGKLVPQDSNDELSDSIPENTPSSPPLDVPESWRWTEFGEIGEISGGFAFKSGDYTPSGVFILRVTNITPSGVISRDEAVFLPPEKVTREIERFYLNEGDILLVMVGGSLGKIGLVTSDILPALLNQNLWRITPVNREVDSQFLRLITDFAVSFQRQITHSTHGHLSREEFRKKPVALPPLAEQRRIVAKVEQLMALVDELETQLAASRATAANLLQAILQEASAPHQPKAEP